MSFCLAESPLCIFMEYVFCEIDFFPLAPFGPTLGSLWRIWEVAGCNLTRSTLREADGYDDCWSRKPLKRIGKANLMKVPNIQQTWFCIIWQLGGSGRMQNTILGCGHNFHTMSATFRDTRIPTISLSFERLVRFGRGGCVIAGFWFSS